MKWKLLIFSAIVLFFIVDVIEPVFGVTSYPINSQRLNDIPTYCIVEPSGLSAADRGKYINMAKEGVSEWSTALQNNDPANSALWEIYSKVISSTDSTNNCDITIHFKGEVKQLSGGGFTTIGLFSPSTQSIDIAYKNLTVGKIYNIILHEIGHSIGLGHYVSDDDEVNKKWYSGDVFSPSIMIPTTNRVPSMMGITNADVNRVFSMYGSDGFYAFSPTTPSIPGSPYIPTPITPVKPIIPIKPFDIIEISQEQIIVKKYDTTYVKISGQIDDSIFHQGNPVYVIVKKPGYGFDTHKIQTTSKGYFELPLVFDNNSEKGWYEVEASYLEHMDTSMNFDFKVSSEHISTPSIKNYATPEPKFTSNSGNFGKYFDNISIESKGNEFTVNSHLSKNLPTKSSIKIIAENACPSKKEIFDKDFMHSPGERISFSFNQLSNNKPTTCTIHFTITNFDGRLLDTVKIDYDSQSKKQIIKQLPKSLETKYNQPTKPIFTEGQKEYLIKQIDVNSVSMLKLKDRMDTTWSYLDSAKSKYTDSQSKQHVTKAWNLYNKLYDQKSNTIQNLDDVTSDYLRLEEQKNNIGKNYFNDFSTKLAGINYEITKIGTDMKYISQELDHAEKAQHSQKQKEEKQCFLFWC
ncbi:MAG: hypothetical protein H8D35_02125 [Nitrosopumilus sp.]|nr:hypothetical protein [Nitrosopumilus sp.]